MATYVLAKEQTYAEQGNCDIYRGADDVGSLIQFSLKNLGNARTPLAADNVTFRAYGTKVHGTAGKAYIYWSMNILETIRIGVLTDLSIGTHMDFYLFILNLLQPSCTGRKSPGGEADVRPSCAGSGSPDGGVGGRLGGASLRLTPQVAVLRGEHITQQRRVVPRQRGVSSPRAHGKVGEEHLDDAGGEAPESVVRSAMNAQTTREAKPLSP
uniref:Uncharacterized protein n=1 Tax=Oryza rufipogon TaxID=4529 RepID=A0A0E0N9V6_ORYRU